MPTDHPTEGRHDSGIRYCIVHDGIIEQDMGSCDFCGSYDDDDPTGECVSRPLFYEDVP